MQNNIEVIARGLLMRGPYILLCQNTTRGYWYLPGGHVEFGEAAAAALVREFWEECRLEIRTQRCVLVSEGTFSAKRPHHEINFVFHVEELGDRDAEIVPAEQGVAFAWFELASLPDVDLRPGAVKAWLIAGGRCDEGSSCTWVSQVQ